MRTPLVHLPTVSSVDRLGPTLIAAGLTTLLIATWWPAAPIVTGMALVALGATATTIARFQEAAALPLATAVSVFVYLSLYLLFVAAVRHAAMIGPQNGLSIYQGLDFGASVMPMALAVRISWRAIAACKDAPTR